MNSKDWRAVLALVMPYIFRMFKRKRIKDGSKNHLTERQTGAAQSTTSVQRPKPHRAGPQRIVRHTQHHGESDTTTDEWDYR